MKQTDRTNNQGLFKQLLLALVMLFPISALAQEYQLWLGGTQVTEANKDNILGGETVTATFNPNNNTLTLNDMNLVGTSSNPSGIISRLVELTIMIVGSNTITPYDSCTAIRADMEGAQTLIIKKGADDCSLVLNASHAIHDFSKLTLNGLFWNDRFTYKFDETLAGYNSGYRLMKSDGVEAKKDNETGFKPTLSDTEEYGIIVTTDVTGPVSVTNKNRTNVLNDEGKSVQFDGEHTLILNNANLQEIEIDEYPTFEASGLTIFLKGTNVIDNDDDYGISYADYTPIPLTFTTTEVNGGQLTCSYDDYSYPFPNLEAKYKNFLLLSQGNENHLIISQQLQPIINNETKEVTLDGGGTGLGKDIKDMSTEELAAGVIVNKVLYLLGDDDGCAESEDVICLNSCVYDNVVFLINQNVISGQYAYPGTSEFANESGFKGLIFLLPAGSGKVIIEYDSGQDGALGVQIGKELHGLDEVNEMTTEEIPYLLTTPSYVYIFALDTDVGARGYTATRAPGNITTATVKIRSIGVKADHVSSAPPPPLSPKRLTKADVDAMIEAKGGLNYGDELTITDADYTSIDADALESFKTNNLKVTYLDLSQTSITGLTVDRKLPPFDRLIDGAFVYLPNGNDLVKYDNYVNIYNVVIGDVCPYVMLPDNDNPFKLAKNFKVGNFEMERSFWEGEYCTICLPFDATPVILRNHKFYQIKSVAGNTITMESVSQPKANVPYMLYPKSGYMSDASNIVEFKKEIPEPTAVDGLTFIGTYATKSIVSSDTEDVFCFIDEGNFVRVKTYPIKINPFHGYMTMPASSGARSFSFDFGGGTTGISEMETMKNGDNEGWYALDGRRLSAMPTKKGIYIHNGNLVVIK